MNENQLLRAFGLIDDRFIEELYQNKGISRKRFRGATLVIIAALFSLLTMTVFAAENDILFENWFYDFFSDQTSAQPGEELTENQKAILGQGLVSIDQSVTQNGYTITLESGISDGHRALLKFRVDGPENVSLNGHYSLLLETDIEMPSNGEENFSVGYSGGTILEDDDPNDNSVTFLREYIFQAPTGTEFSLADGSIWNFHVDGIQEYGDTANSIIADGSWDFTVKFADDLLVTNTVELLEKPIKCSAKRSLRNWKQDIHVKVTSFQLRTISATVLFDKPLTGFWEGVNLDDEIYLVMKDGSRIEAQFQMSANRGSYEECMYLFDCPISFEDVAYVEFRGTK